MSFDFMHSVLHLVSIFLLTVAALKLWRARRTIKEYQFWIVLFGVLLTITLLIMQISVKGFMLTKNPFWTLANSITAYTIMLISNRRYNAIFSLENRSQVHLSPKLRKSLKAFDKNEVQDVFNWKNLGACEIGQLVVLGCGKIAFKRLPDVAGRRLILVYLLKGAKFGIHEHFDMAERGYVIKGSLYDTVLYTDAVLESEYFYYPPGMLHDPMTDEYTELFIEFSKDK